MKSSYSRLVRFIPKGNQAKALIGEPQDTSIDIGLAVYQGHDVKVDVFSGSSILQPGAKTSDTAVIDRLLSPLAQSEIGAIHCVGLNYVSHAKEMGLPLPEIPTVFLKPETSLASGWPTPFILPHMTQRTGTGDFEAEMAIVIGKCAKDVPVDKALDYVLGFTAANDISSRALQNAQSQWCFSKGFDASCPIGPTFISSSIINPSKLHIRGIRNGNIVQDCSLEDMIFDVPHLVSFLSQGTTLHPGTVILTGTPPGVGAGQRPPDYLLKEMNFE